MKINLENVEPLEDCSPEIELRILGKPEKLNPHHVPGSKPSALVTIQQGWTNKCSELNRITSTIEQGWFIEQTLFDREPGR